MDEFEANKYIKAKQRVEEEKAFYGNLIAYCIVVPGLSILNYWMDQWAFPWFLFSALGWGIGVFFHAVKVFKWNPIMGKDWENRKIKQFMDEEDRKQRNWE